MYAKSVYIAVASLLAVSSANPLIKRQGIVPQCDTTVDWAAVGGKCATGICTVGGLTGRVQCPKDFPAPGGDATEFALNQQSCNGLEDGRQCTFHYTCCTQ
ncbi:uncharacterized protein LY79DRAFT_178393 [Colletotrichum navitas]|uniref:Uncharacterized protein n=1 Tax=Colletotrichum navitas TaxID=681940 RepID=A0AAD8V5I1_9PEZI|nr:uncharacterized protein LY79DRAFT_178393 [Colletotrichum navitas]KAK1593403.1 hypothetical protein LY79DRAFT_178393 [Colletotrichum navitas]